MNVRMTGENNTQMCIKLQLRECGKVCGEELLGGQRVGVMKQINRGAACMCSLSLSMKKLWKTSETNRKLHVKGERIEAK